MYSLLLRAAITALGLSLLRDLKREMAELVLAPAKVAKKKSPKPRKTGPSVGELIVKAVSASKERNGVSAAALKKALAAGGYDVEKNKARVKIAIRSLVAKGTLVQTKGTGTFKMSEKVAEDKAKKPAAKKAAKKPKKSAAAKKPAAVKSPRKSAARRPRKAAAKRPRKAAAKRPRKAAAKRPRKAAAKRPRKAAAKRPRKAAAKKAPAKKAAKPEVKKTAAARKK